MPPWLSTGPFAEANHSSGKPLVLWLSADMDLLTSGPFGNVGRSAATAAAAEPKHGNCTPQLNANSSFSDVVMPAVFTLLSQSPAYVAGATQVPSSIATQLSGQEALKSLSHDAL